MADFDFGDIASRYLQKRLDPINQLINDPNQYLQNRVEDSIGVKFDNTATNAPSTMPPLASQQPMAPVDYSISAPQSKTMGLPQQGPVAPSTWQGQTDEFGGMEEKPLQQRPQTGGRVSIQIPEGPAVPETTPQVPEAAAVQAPVAQPQPRPSARPATQAELIAQQESGRNPNIGYHYPADESGQRKSTAFGKFGITAPAYADIQKSDPYFAGRPITSLSQEEQDRAFQVDRTNRTKQLQAFGIEPTNGALSAAHFAGAQGLSNFLTKKDEQGRPYISPAAQAANGGYDKARAIIESRLNGGTAPASAAAQQQGAVSPEQAAAQAAAAPAPTTAPEAYTGQGITVGGMNQAQLQALNSKDPKELFKLAYDMNTNPGVQKLALDNLYNDANTRKRVADAEAAVEKRLAAGDVNGLTRDMNKKGEEGSYLKAILFKRLGLDSLAQQEMEKISPTPQYGAVMLANGERVNVKTSKATGQVLSAFDEKGNEITDKEKLGQIAAQAVSSSQIGQAGSTRVRDSKGTEWSVVPTSQGSIFYNTAGVRGIPEGTTTPITVGGDLELQKKLAEQKLALNLVYKPATVRAEEVAKWESNNGPLSPEVRAQLLGPSPAQTAAAGKPTAPGAAPAPTAAIAPSGAAPAPTAAIAPSTPGMTPADITAARKQTEKEGEAFVKYGAEEITPKADAGGQVARIRKQQVNGPDGVLANPELSGLLQGQGGKFDEVRNIFRDLITGNYKDGDDLSRRVASLDLTQRQKDVLYTQIGLNTQLNPLTLKANAGPGAVSDAEQKLNALANVDITRQPLYSGLTLMTRSQFINDTAVARAEFKNANPQLTTTSQFNSAWAKEKGRLEKEYENIYAERAKYIAQYNKDGKNPGAVVDAYKHYPVPEYDSETKQWVYRGYSDKARRPKLDAFVK
jgi:hypothetical protein